MIKIGDLVRWIGYPGSSLDPSVTGPDSIGLVIEIVKIDSIQRCKIIWGDGTVGKRLYPQTLEVIKTC